ncbi:putative tubulin-folding cofactor E [Paratrimastix pyriformis]|uniref:Tubulin-folding cofactor E n=1 Tax=Paratrimastix pyriformis TaxID=342808 RepID=A0ABQ8UWW8_9EUKA|nr:putative tubulin-folding cofactor E [Paratrimastix pyriformis]
MLFSDAVIQRYSTNDSEHIRPEMYVLTSSSNRKVIEFVGEEKAHRKFSKLNELRAAEIRDIPITGAGDIGALCPNLISVDLSSTQQNSWDVVFAISHQLPELQTLQLQRNPRLPRPLPEDILAICRNLRLLSLNNTGMRWGDVSVVAGRLPFLEELLLCENDIDHLQGGPTGPDGAIVGFPRLQSLNLDGNLLASWDEVWRLRNLPNLQTLFLCNNRLASVFWGPAHPTAAAAAATASPAPAATSAAAVVAPGGAQDDRIPFMALTNLALDGNTIAEWGSIDALARFACLASVRLQRNPLFERRPGGPLEGVLRYLTIARVGDHMRVLNKTPISDKERQDAELYYRNTLLAQYNEERRALEQHHAPPAPAEGRPPYKSAAFYQAHPRWDQILQRYGEPAPSAASTTGEGGLASQMLELTLLTTVLPSMSGAALQRADPTQRMCLEGKRLPQTMKVARLKQQMCTWFGVDPRLALELVVRGSRDEPGGQPLGEEDRPLSSYGLWSGCVVVLQEAADRPDERRPSPPGGSQTAAIAAAEAIYQATRRGVAEEKAAYAQAAQRR